MIERCCCCCYPIKLLSGYTHVNYLDKRKTNQHQGTHTKNSTTIKQHINKQDKKTAFCVVFLSLQNTRPDQLLSQDDDTLKLTPHRRSLLFSVQFGSVLFSTAKRRENLLHNSRSQTLGSQHGTRERKPKRRKNKASKQEQQG
jgi:hypothetical protein